MEDVEGDDDEQAEMEAELGIDLDGDGDISEEGTRVSGKETSAKLMISHEAWMACEMIVEADLVLRHVIPIDQRFLIIAVGAPVNVLVEEAAHNRTL